MQCLSRAGKRKTSLIGCSANIRSYNRYFDIVQEQDPIWDSSSQNVSAHRRRPARVRKITSVPLAPATSVPAPTDSFPLPNFSRCCGYRTCPDSARFMPLTYTRFKYYMLTSRLNEFLNICFIRRTSEIELLKKRVSQQYVR